MPLHRSTRSILNARPNRTQALLQDEVHLLRPILIDDKSVLEEKPLIYV